MKKSMITMICLILKISIAIAQESYKEQIAHIYASLNKSKLETGLLAISLHFKKIETN